MQDTRSCIELHNNPEDTIIFKSCFIPAKSLISPLNKNMHPCSKLSFLYSSRNTAFWGASSADDVLAGHLSMYHTGNKHDGATSGLQGGCCITVRSNSVTVSHLWVTCRHSATTLLAPFHRLPWDTGSKWWTRLSYSCACAHC